MSLTDDPYPELPVTMRHRIGLAIGRALDRWLIRGYHYGNFRNAMANGLHESTRAAGTCYSRQCRGMRDIAAAALTYVHAEPGADDCQQSYHEMEMAVEHYEATARQVRPDA